MARADATVETPEVMIERRKRRLTTMAPELCRLCCGKGGSGRSVSLHNSHVRQQKR